MHLGSGPHLRWFDAMPPRSHKEGRWHWSRTQAHRPPARPALRLWRGPRARRRVRKCPERPKRPPRAVAMPRGFRDAAFSRKASRQRLEPRGGPAMTVAECPRGQGRDLRRGERGWPGCSTDERRWRDQGNVGPAYTAKKMTLRFWRRVARQPLCPRKGWVL
jgi:hypothetical protein